MRATRTLPIDQVLRPPLVSPALLDFAPGSSRQRDSRNRCRAVVAGARAMLDAALEQAAREIEQHMPEAVPVISARMAPRRGSMSPRPPRARASTSATAVQDHHPRLFRCHRFSPQADLGHDALVRRVRRALHEGERQPDGCRERAEGRRGGGQLEDVGDGLPWPSPSIPEGAVVVLSPNHVGFFSGLEGDRVFLLGGNQSDRVDRTPFPRSQVVAVRWLNLAPAQDMAGAAPASRGTVGTLSDGAVGGLSRQARRDGVRQQLRRGEPARLLRPMAIRRRRPRRYRVCARGHDQPERCSRPRPGPARMASTVAPTGWPAARCPGRGHAHLHARALQKPGSTHGELQPTRRRRASPACWLPRI